MYENNADIKVGELQGIDYLETGVYENGRRIIVFSTPGIDYRETGVYENLHYLVFAFFMV